MALFNQLYQFKGKHAEMVRKIVDAFGGNTVCRNIDVFYISAVFGLWQHRRADIDSETSIEPAKIDPEQMVRFNDEIEYFFHLVMLSDENYCKSIKVRTDKAFRYDATSESSQRDEIHFTQIVLGGLEFFYEQIVENTNSPNDIFCNLRDVVNSFYDEFGEINEDEFYAK